MLKSHFIVMVIFSLITAVLLAFIKFDEKKEIIHYWLKLFIYMIGGVILFSWVMYFL